ncbi:MAG: hypothetical protein COB69_00800 [Phycisphaera sp.]|nr:MAG: hypothetical protein COB69_00800 [Phycisphaera sp.]
MVATESQQVYTVGVIVTEPTRTKPIRLTQLAQGQSARLDSSSLPDIQTEELRAMGLGPECELRVCKMGEPCIIWLGSGAGGCRIALAKKLADHLHVRPC